ncbi:hypothetical protein [Streptomyces sp. NPDC047043]|uniref:hypothetical protein n=1 Tax=Streptomyces sp. NPDC047043 TaxID=3154497 RepID=UPI0033EC8821
MITRTVEAPPSSVECTLAQRSGYGDLHDQCHQTNDVPLPYSADVLLQRRCYCPCHGHGESSR